MPTFRKIIIVDDKEQILYMMQVLMESHGFEVIQAKNGREALKLARKSPPDIIITDVLMPVMDGYALCREWMNDEKLKNIPFIFNTATYVNPNDKKFGLKLGADRFLVKGVDTDKLIDVVNEVLNEDKTSKQDKIIEYESAYLKEYNETLVRKLEEKVLQLEKFNNELKVEIEERHKVEVSLKESEKKLAKYNEQLEEKVENRTKELTKAQSQIIQSEKMASLGLLTAGIAHEINNPVNFMRISSIALSQDLRDVLELLKKFKEHFKNGKQNQSEIVEFEKKIDLDFLEEALKQELDNILEGTKRTADIVKGLRQFSHGDEVEMKNNSLHDGIDITLKFLRSRISEKVIIKKNYDQSIKNIYCHIGQLNQVIMNLLANALDAIGEEGKIEIITKKRGDNVTISIKDNGPGIPEETRVKIFDPFFTTKVLGEGTGLGLSISHGIIENHGGTISVNSEVGKGTEFVISLPAKQQ